MVQMRSEPDLVGIRNTCPCLAVIPLGEMLELAASHWPLRERRSFDSDAHARRLACCAALLRDGFGMSDNTARDEPLAALSLAREHENRVALGDHLAATKET